MGHPAGSLGQRLASILGNCHPAGSRCLLTIRGTWQIGQLISEIEPSGLVRVEIAGTQVWVHVNSLKFPDASQSNLKRSNPRAAPRKAKRSRSELSYVTAMAMDHEQ